MPQVTPLPAHRPVKPIPLRQSKGVRVYQGAQGRTMVGSISAICRMLELEELAKLASA